MYRAAYRLLGNAQDAEDMVQEAFIRLWEKRETAMQAGNAEAYCVALTKNLCIDRLRLKRLNYANTPPENLDLPDGKPATRNSSTTAIVLKSTLPLLSVETNR